MSVSFETTVDCCDVTVTRDGHLLLAACSHGLLVYDELGVLLRSWRAMRWIDGQEDDVNCVAALSDGRALAGLSNGQVVVLPRHWWTGDAQPEVSRLIELPATPRRLAVHADLVAVTEGKYDDRLQAWVWGHHVVLVNLSSGETLYRHGREYSIWSLAVTALCVVTTSVDPVKLDSSASSYIMDAYSHAGVFIWRVASRFGELVRTVYATAESWSVVYATMWKKDGSSVVVAIGGTDGKLLSDAAMSIGSDAPRLLSCLSIARVRRRTVAAVLDFDKAISRHRSVTLYEAVSESVDGSRPARSPARAPASELTGERASRDRARSFRLSTGAPKRIPIGYL